MLFYYVVKQTTVGLQIVFYYMYCMFFFYMLYVLTCVAHYNPNSFHFAPHCMTVHARITTLPLCRMHPFVRVVRELNKYTLIIMISDKELNILVCFKQWHMRRPLGMD